MSKRNRPLYTVDDVHELFHRTLADEAVATSRRSQRAKFRPPHIRPWGGIAAGAQPYRRGTSSAVGWWVFVAAVAACAAMIGAALGITPTFF